MSHYELYYVYIEAVLNELSRRLGFSTITIRYLPCVTYSAVIPLNIHHVTAARGTRTVVTNIRG